MGRSISTSVGPAGADDSRSGPTYRQPRNDNVGDATLIVVAYRSPSLNLAWVPSDARVIVVHNDGSLNVETLSGARLDHIGDQTNVGFGAGVDLALPMVSTERVILANPDTELSAEHWDALACGGEDEIVVIPLVDCYGHQTSVLNRYPTPTAAILTALRVGRLVPRHGATRQVLARFLGRWGAEHRRSLVATYQERRVSAGTHWPSAAACSYPTDLMRSVGGFDPEYFLYLEDVDLARRMAALAPELMVRQVAIDPGIHLVSASSATREGRSRADLELARSALRYASSEQGPAWHATATVLRLLVRWRTRRALGRV